MKEFELTILGCGSAKPTPKHYPTSQVLKYREKVFMIDCGEGTQQQLMRYGVNHNRLQHIFISHLHGDHCFGLIGLISSLSLSKRTSDLVIHSHSDLERLLTPQLNYFCRDLSFKVIFEPIPSTPSEIYRDKSLIVTSFKLKHRVPTYGFRFQEVEKPPHINKPVTDFYKIPLKELPQIKLGADYITPDGRVVENKRLVLPPTESQSYAYCSDTSYAPSIEPYIKGVTLLYHEATYSKDLETLAKQRSHTTAEQAAKIANLADAEQLIIGHFSQRYRDENTLLNEAKEVFSNTILAKEGLKVTF